MKTLTSTLLAALAGTLMITGSAAAGEKAARLNNASLLGLGNEAIDFAAFMKAAEEAGEHRKTRRVTESEFIAMAGEENTIVLDTRSAAKFALLRVKGALNVNFSEITTATLAGAIPDKDTRILIYCNNNFDNAPVAMPRKTGGAALNIPTFITLYAYGYKNLYELGPLLDVKKTRIELEGMKFARK